MVTTPFCVRGYWLIGRLNNARRPSTTISRLITLASTGRLMKMSVKFMARYPQCSCGVGFGLFAGCTLLSITDRRAVLQLVLAAGDHGLAFLDAGEHGHLVAPGRAGRDEHLLRHQLRIALVILGHILRILGGRPASARTRSSRTGCR
jgi:hypothetical protein